MLSNVLEISGVVALKFWRSTGMSGVVALKFWMLTGMLGPAWWCDSNRGLTQWD